MSIFAIGAKLCSAHLTLSRKTRANSNIMIDGNAGSGIACRLQLAAMQISARSFKESEFSGIAELLGIQKLTDLLAYVNSRVSQAKTISVARISVRSIQDDIITLMDWIYLTHQSDQGLLSNLDEFVQSLAQRFPTLFDKERPISAYSKSQRLPHTLVMEQKIVKSLRKMSADDKLVKVISDIFSAANPMTFHKLAYLELAAEKFAESPPLPQETKAFDMAILKHLISLNLNSPAVFQYCVEKMLLQGSGKPLTEHLEFIAHTKKVVNQAIVELRPAYERRWPSLQDQLDKWLSAEMFYLEKKLAHSANSDHSDFKGFTVHTRLSVSQIACMARLCVESKLIVTTNYMHLFRAIARTMRTKQTSDISVESLRNKFYEIEYGTRTAIRKELLGMIEALGEF